MKIIGVLLIATNKYFVFVQPLIDGIKKNLLSNHQIIIHLFTDEFREYFGDDRVKIEQHIIPSYCFPQATLYRYKIFDVHKESLKNTDYLFYSDVDMAIVDTVGDEILGEGLTVTYHPAFYVQRDVVGHWGSNGVVRESNAWIEPEKRFGYCAGGFNGGTTKSFLEMSKILNEKIADDESRNIMAEWHDESFINFYCKNTNAPILYLTPTYCMVEQLHLRKLWGIDNLPVKIVALEKNHEEIRAL